MDKVYQFIGKASSAKSDKVYTGISDWLFSCYNIWRNVLAETASTLDHNISAYMTELMA